MKLVYLVSNTLETFVTFQSIVLKLVNMKVMEAFWSLTLYSLETDQNLVVGVAMCLLTIHEKETNYFYEVSKLFIAV